MTNDMSNELWNKRRERLEENLLHAALELMAHTGAEACAIPIKDTTPPLSVRVGAAEEGNDWKEASPSPTPSRAWCNSCKAVIPCDWRPNSETCADLCCSSCDSILVCVHEFAAQAGAEFQSGCNDIGACGCKTPCDMPKEPAPANAAQAGQAVQEPVASERPINDWLALTIRNTAFAEAAELFPQPFVDYDGHTIQAKIRAQISQYATLNLRPTLSNSEIDCITSSFKQSDHHDSIRACITAAFTSPQKLVPSPPAQARQEPVNIPVMVRAWHAAEQERLDCVVAYNVAIESVKKHEWPGPCTDREYQAMTAAANKAHALKAPMHEQMKEMIYPAVPPAPANALAIVQAALEAALEVAATSGDDESIAGIMALQDNPQLIIDGMSK